MTQEERIKAATCLQDLTVWNREKCISDAYRVPKCKVRRPKAPQDDIDFALDCGLFDLHQQLDDTF